MKAIFFAVAIFACGLYAGHRYEADYVHRTCESSDTPTVINGDVYICYPQWLIQRMREQAERRVQS